MTTHEYFVQAQQIESLAVEFYAMLAQLCAGDPPRQAEFQRLADEVVQHEARIRMLAAQHSANSKLFAGVDRLQEHLEEVHVSAVDLLDHLTRGAWGLDLDSICARLVTFEEQLGRLYAEKMSRGSDPAISQFFEELAQQDRSHAEILRRVAG